MRGNPANDDKSRLVSVPLAVNCPQALQFCQIRLIRPKIWLELDLVGFAKNGQNPVQPYVLQFLQTVLEITVNDIQKFNVKQI